MFRPATTTSNVFGFMIKIPVVGGGAEYKKVPEDTNLIYYIVSGEMTVTTDEGEFILHAGDSICFQPGDGRSCRNTGMEAATMLVITGK